MNPLNYWGFNAACQAPFFVVSLGLPGLAVSGSCTGLKPCKLELKRGKRRAAVQTVDEYLRQLESENIVKQREAAYFLGNFRDARILPALERLIDSPDPILRENVRKAIAQISEHLKPEQNENKHLKKKTKWWVKYLALAIIKVGIVDAPWLLFKFGLMEGAGAYALTFALMPVYYILLVTAVVFVVSDVARYWMQRSNQTSRQVNAEDWQCPKCQAANPGTTLTCAGCSFRLG
jgi:hypothetical protein